MATITMLLLNCVVVFIAEASRNSASNSPIYQGYLWILSLMGIQPPSFGDYRLCLPLLVGCAVYYFSRRSPENVGKGLAWVAGVNLFVAVFHVLSYLLRGIAVVSDFEPFLGVHGVWWPTQAIFALLLLLLNGLALVCTAGEWMRVTQERSMDAELREAEKSDEEVAQRLRRRRELLLASAGPQIPVWLAFDRIVAQLIMPVWFCYFIYVQPWDIQKELPAPQFETSDQRRSTNDIPVLARIYAEGFISLNNEAMAMPSDRQLDVFAKSLRAIVKRQGSAYVLLQLDADAKHERLIDFVNAAQRVHCPIQLAE